MSSEEEKSEAQACVVSYDEKLNNIRSVTSNHLESFDEIEKKAATGFDLFHEAQNLTQEEIEENKKRVVRKIDKRIIPILCITYTLQFLDKLSLNYAAAYSFKEDLGLVGRDYNWVAAIFNFGYMAGAIPANYLIQRYPVAKFTGSMIFVWAILLLGHIGATNYGGILVLRFLLGLMESCISPSCMLINSSFYTKDEQPLRMCLFLSFNGVATMVGALLSYGLGHATESSLKPWKLIFLTIGLINLVWSIVFLYFCPNSPADAKFLTQREKVIAIERIAHNHMGIKNKKYKSYQIVEAALDYKTFIYALIGLACGVINGGSSNFQSALLKGFGFSGISTTILQLPTGAIELVVVICAGILIFSVKNTRCITFVLLCVPGLAGLIGIHVIPLEHKWALVGCTWLQYIIGGPVILSWIFLNANVAGQTKRSISNGIWFAFYAAGNIVGANIFYSNQAPKYVSGIIGLVVCYVGMMVLGIVYRLGLMWENKGRDKLYGEVEGETEEMAMVNGFKDFTDKENTGFRYQL